MVVVWVCFMCPVVVLCPAPAPALHLRSVMATQTFLPFPNVTWFLAPSWTRYLFSLECLPLLSFLGTSLSYIQDPGASLDSTLEPFIHISFTGTFLHCPMVVYRLVSPTGCWSPRKKGCFLSFIDSWAPTQILGHGSPLDDEAWKTAMEGRVPHWELMLSSFGYNRIPYSVLLKLQWCARESECSNTHSDSVDLERGLKVCISNQFPWSILCMSGLQKITPVPKKDDQSSVVLGNNKDEFWQERAYGHRV